MNKNDLTTTFMMVSNVKNVNVNKCEHAGGKPLPISKASTPPPPPPLGWRDQDLMKVGQNVAIAIVSH